MNRIRNYCNSCSNDTWHEIAAHIEQSRVDYLFGENQQFDGEILRCCGCDLLAFRLVTHPFEFQDKADMPEIEHYPERDHNKRKKRFFFSMPITVRTLYNETVAAHDGKLVLLSAVGLRALIEAIVVDKIETSKFGYSLESKINALSDILEPKVLSTLHDFRTVGNEAVHAQVIPDRLDIHRALYVAESLLEFFYGIEEGADNYLDNKVKPKTTKKPRIKVLKTPRVE